MPLFKFLNKDKKDDNDKPKKKDVVKDGLSISSRQAKKEKSTPKRVNAKKDTKKTAKATKDIVSSQINKWIIGPHITEKAARFAEVNKYIFKVPGNASKVEISKAIERFYGVTVVKNNIINIPRKKRITRRREWFKSGYKKSIVTLMKGDKIEMASH